MSANELGPFEDPETRTAHAADDSSAEVALSAGVSGLDSAHHLVGGDGEEEFGEDTADETDRFRLDKDPITVVRGADGVYAREDESGTGTVDIPRGARGSATANDQPSLWRPVDRARPEGRGHLHVGPRGLVAGVAAVTLALTVTTGYEAYSSIRSAGLPPESSQSGPLRAALQPTAEALAEQAIAESGEQADGKPGVFHATQEGPGEVELVAGGDNYEAGASFDGEAAVVDVVLTGAGLDASDITAADAGDVSEVFVETTKGIPDSGGFAEDTQADISNPGTSQARDHNDLAYLGSEAGDEWSGTYGTNNDRTDNGYVGASSDPSDGLPGPGPNHDTPIFDDGYWGGGSPPLEFADGGNATQDQTAKDAAAQTKQLFGDALQEIEHN